MVYYILLILMTLLGALGSYFLKKASACIKTIDCFKSIHFYIGGTLYFSSALLNIYILRFLDFSVVLPLTALTYVWTMLLSFYFLKEKITIKKILGVACILLGAFAIALS